MYLQTLSYHHKKYIYFSPVILRDLRIDEQTDKNSAEWFCSSYEDIKPVELGKPWTLGKRINDLKK